MIHSFRNIFECLFHKCHILQKNVFYKGLGVPTVDICHVKSFYKYKIFCKDECIKNSQL